MTAILSKLIENNFHNFRVTEQCSEAIYAAQVCQMFECATSARQIIRSMMGEGENLKIINSRNKL